MKFVLALLVAGFLTACSASVSTSIKLPGPTAPAPIEGVYPDCNFGVTSPESGGPAACLPPAVN